MRILSVLLLILNFSFLGYSQVCEFIVGGEVTIDILNFSITNITDNGTDCTLAYSLDYRVNNPNGCQVNFQALVKTDGGSQSNFNVTGDGAWHTETGSIFNATCIGTTTIDISGGWGWPCTQQNVAWPGVTCLSVAYSNVGLPVEIINFEVANNENQVDLFWTTASETDNKQFIIEHSANGDEDFKEIGVIDGVGSSTSLQDYAFTHRAPAVGQNYYRLQQVDFNGNISYSKSIVIEIAYEGEIDIYPNPTLGNVNFKIPTDLSTTFEIFNQSGQLLQPEKSVQSDDVISLDGLPVGWYIFRIKTTQGITVRRIYKI